MSFVPEWRKQERQAYSQRRYAEKKHEKDLVAQWAKENPEAYAAKVKEIQDREAAKLRTVMDFQEDMTGLEFFKAVSVHVCPDLMCGCDIGETPALTSPLIRKSQVCRKCNQTYSALLYNVGWTTTNQHTCGDWGIFVFNKDEIRKHTDVSNLYQSWRSKVLLAGDGQDSKTQYHGHYTLQWFKPSKALFVICTNCSRPIIDGMVSFSSAADGESNLVCSNCTEDPGVFPYGFEVREDEIGFFRNADFDWMDHNATQKEKAEREFLRYKNVMQSLENMEKYGY